MAGQAAALTTAGIIAAWYGSNIGVLLLNKYLLSIYGFKFPVFLTLCHMLACSVTSYAVAASRLVPLAPLRSRRQLGKVAVLAVVFCLTVVLGNVSLRFIPVSFNQAVGATTPAFTAAMSLALLRQRESRATYLSLVPVMLGIVIASGAEPLFNLVGFAAAISATGARAFKSVLQGLLLSDPGEKMDSMSLLTYMAPVAVLSLLPTMLLFEPGAAGVAVALGRDGRFWGLLALNSFMAYFVNLTNFLVTKHTSALTLQVLGNAKGVVAVIISVLYFRNPVNLYSVLGYAITVTGVVLYSQARKRSHKEALLKEMKGGGDPEVGQVAPPGSAAGYAPGRGQQKQQQQQQRRGLLQHLGFHAAVSQAPAPATGHWTEAVIGTSTATLLAGGDKLSQTASGRAAIFVDATTRSMPAPA